MLRDAFIVDYSASLCEIYKSAFTHDFISHSRAGSQQATKTLDLHEGLHGKPRVTLEAYSVASDARVCTPHFIKQLFWKPQPSYYSFNLSPSRNILAPRVFGMPDITLSHKGFPMCDWHELSSGSHLILNRHVNMLCFYHWKYLAELTDWPNMPVQHGTWASMAATRSQHVCRASRFYQQRLLVNCWFIRESLLFRESDLVSSFSGIFTETLETIANEQ